MMGLLCVGAGGALGAMGRYGLGLIPLGGELPLMTLLINFLGSVAIGAIVETSELAAGALSREAVLFLKVAYAAGSRRSPPSRWRPSSSSRAVNTPSLAPTPWSASFCASPACWSERCSLARSCRQARRQKSRVGCLG